MGWTTPRTWTVGEMVTHTLLNAQLKDNLVFLSTHAHSGVAGDGSTTRGNLVKATYADASAPSAPGSSKTVIYAVSGRMHMRAGSGGSDTEIQISTDLHNQDHDTRHEPSGGDTMAVDASAATGSLRTLGSGSTQAAAGNHAPHAT